MVLFESRLSAYLYVHTNVSARNVFLTKGQNSNPDPVPLSYMLHFVTTSQFNNHVLVYNLALDLVP